MTRLNVIIDNTAVLTFHPKLEAIKAKEYCDNIANTPGIFEIHTVSTDATTVYWEYGKFVKDIDVHLYLNGKDSTLGQVFESYNESLDYIRSIITDEAYEKMEE